MIVCARCGAQNQPTNKFCLSCGAPVQKTPSQSQPAANPQPAPAPQNPGGYGSPQPAPQGQPNWGYGSPPQQPPPQGDPNAGWGQPRPAPGGYQPQGGYAPSPQPGYGPPEGPNPFGATVGPNPGGQEAPQPGYQGGYGTPYPGAPQQPPPAAPPWGQNQYPGTSPPPAMPNDYGAQRPQQPPMVPVAPPPSPRPQERQQPSLDPEQVDPNAPRVLAGFLVSYEGSELGVSYPILQGQTLVGRKGAGSGAQIELEHGTASSRHAVLWAAARPGRIKVEDIGSTNGTFVGDLMLERGKKHELKDGDVVRFGGYVAIVKIV